MDRNMELGRCLYGAGACMLGIGVLLFVLLVIMGENLGRRSSWSSYLDSPWDRFKRGMRRAFVSLLFFLGIVVGLVGFYFGMRGPYPNQSEMLFGGLALSYLSFFIMSLRVLFWGNNKWEDARDRVSRLRENLQTFHGQEKSK